MKIERIRKVFDVTQAELASFMGLSRSFISMNERKQRTFSSRDNHRIDTMYEAVFREPEQHALTAIQRLQGECQDAIHVDIKRQLGGFQQKVQNKEMELERAQKHCQNLQSRLVAILHLEEALKGFDSELNEIHNKWLEVQKLNTQYKLKNEGLSRIHQIELELHQLKSKQEFLERRLSK